MADSKLIHYFKEELKRLERYIRIFEMTYLDLKDNLQVTLKDKNL